MASKKVAANDLLKPMLDNSYLERWRNDIDPVAIPFHARSSNSCLEEAVLKDAAKDGLIRGTTFICTEKEPLTYVYNNDPGAVMAFEQLASRVPYDEFHRRVLEKHHPEYPSILQKPPYVEYHYWKIDGLLVQGCDTSRGVVHAWLGKKVMVSFLVDLKSYAAEWLSNAQWVGPLRVYTRAPYREYDLEATCQIVMSPASKYCDWFRTLSKKMVCDPTEYFCSGEHGKKRMPVYGECYICGEEIDLADAKTCQGHHVIPTRYGGTDDPDNILLVHPRCHHRIHAKYTKDAISAAYAADKEFFSNCVEELRVTLHGRREKRRVTITA